MYAAASRLDAPLLKALIRLDDRSVPIAETHRRSREVAAALGVPRPSYECVRLLVHDARRQQDRRRIARNVLIDVALYTKPIQALYQLD
jgi:hypothetical protein